MIVGEIDDLYGISGPSSRVSKAAWCVGFEERDKNQKGQYSRIIIVRRKVDTAMYMRAVPPMAIKCGSDSFVVSGVNSAALARVTTIFPTEYVAQKIQSVVVKRLQGDPDLLMEASHMQTMGWGYTIDAEPRQISQESWEVPFTAYIFEKGQRE